MFKILFFISLTIFMFGCGGSDSTSSSSNTVEIDENNITSDLKEIIDDINNGDIIIDDNVTINETYVSSDVFEGVKIYPSYVYSNDIHLLAIDDNRLASFSRVDQIRIAQKLLSSLYYGMDINDIERMLDSQNFIYTLSYQIENSKLTSDELENIEEEINSHEYYYRYDTLQKSLAKIYYTPMSIDYFDYYTTYILQNTILFSSGFELDSVSIDEVINSSNYLFSELKNKKSMEIIVYNHLRSQWNWARFRSPEDNTREMLELFLMNFDDSLVPITSLACKNYSFNDDSGKLIVDAFTENTTELELFNNTIINCFDFHRELVNHKDFLKTQVRRLVDYYFPTYEVLEKESIVSLIVLSNPETYQDIIKQIIFSEEYLLRSDKVKSIEEATFFIAKTTDFYPYKRFFWYLYDDLVKMEQRTNTYKLGRKLLTPVDAKSLSYYRYSLYNKMINDTKSNLFDDNDGGWSTGFIDSIDESDIRSFINHLSRSFISRNLTSQELDYLEEKLGSSLDISSSLNKREVVKIIMYYTIYLLPEYYKYKKIEGGLL